MFKPQSGSRVRRAITVAALGAAACAPVTRPDPEPIVTSAGPDGLVQRLVLEPRTVARGDTLHIVSTVVNTGSAPAAVTAQVCGLGVTTTDSVFASDNGIRCVAFSVDVRLAPGDSMTGTDRRAVIGGPGRYTVRVQHLLRSGLAAVGAITVR